ncbi:josephin-2-like [Saccoglossus kowalevskii]|uniref:ubiquitinyl hydrolase 1 n=1 Tax=Saccoglossus kowalevskii TaxID=10224 RepID=A0ABM0GTD3_SACKO|nr:PREDICTED: josephin-1-like [Saccoglossus kowalevskii]
MPIHWLCGSNINNSVVESRTLCVVDQNTEFEASDNTETIVRRNCTMPIYHEKQKRELCALHALNNVFQDGQAYNKQMLDEICQNLAPSSMLNPHKSVLGLGNYDVNVIMAALQLRNCEAVWWDKRKNLDILNFDNIIGFILNMPSPLQWGLLSLPIKRKHWVAVRELDGAFYNLDSKFKSPDTIGDREALKSFFRAQTRVKECELLLVVSKEIADVRGWKFENGVYGGACAS